MWALEVPGYVTWSPGLVFVSIALGMVLGYAALAVALGRNDKWGTFVAALLLTLAIVSHHFTAMGAVQIVPDPTLNYNDTLSLSPAFLALAIAGVALSVLGMSLVGVLTDRRLATRTSRFKEIIGQLSIARQQLEGSQRELQEQKLRLDTAINNMVEGVCMFDAEKRLVVCNERYARLYQLPPELLRTGTPHTDIIPSHRERHPQGRHQRRRGREIRLEIGRVAIRCGLEQDRRIRGRSVDLRDATANGRRRVGGHPS
jgi:PAS domain-containing protein